MSAVVVSLPILTLIAFMAIEGTIPISRRTSEGLKKKDRVKHKTTSPNPTLNNCYHFVSFQINLHVHRQLHYTVMGKGISYTYMLVILLLHTLL